MTAKKLLITPKVKVGELLDTYPELEETLMQLAPAFKKLKNPILRKTVGKVATLQQAATVGNVPLNKIINVLREKVGQESLNFSDSTDQKNKEKPTWFQLEAIVKTIDATPIINKGENPMEMILAEVKNLEKGKILLLLTPFEPAPIIEVLENKGFSVYSVQKNTEAFENYIIPIIIQNAP